MKRCLINFFAALAMAGGVGSNVGATEAVQPSWITLGTVGGPVSNPDRSQPANVLQTDQGAVIIDAGDGTAQQLAKAHVPLQSVRVVVLSHLHWDHTGGLQAILGLRYQLSIPGKLKIYGPPGTADLVSGLVASMKPGADAGYGDPNSPKVKPADTVDVVEVAPDTVTSILPGVSLTAVQNTHYSFAPGSELDVKYKSYSYRFNLPGRSIVYTGDTGPSEAVERLAKGADLLICEMIDVDATVANIRRNVPDTPAAVLQGVTWHLSHHHLTPAQVGELAYRAGVKRLVVTHLVPGNPTPAQITQYLSEIRRTYSGPTEIADDLDRF
jgi:ribonuclease BN (tRNA processing enzyme)